MDKHYNSNHRILLVGEGDFSFSASLAVAFGSAPNMIATSLDSVDFLKNNYKHAMSNIEKLRSRKCIVMHGIDATEVAMQNIRPRMYGITMFILYTVPTNKKQESICLTFEPNIPNSSLSLWSSSPFSDSSLCKFSDRFQSMIDAMRCDAI
ncbi:unnamed protein product [Fraxinus pennsylvanica]|uniref:25S rRNA (uridine-N(3))-methyltransferase BMT5-like domain-containing protein n=1 Tax=Fraxinus pennsylvanica TaxID=56036 RepID=A0AAD1YVN6_9LAMI|nr:unnamed protein product [Fraxinus pennsylvanica]